MVRPPESKVVPLPTSAKCVVASLGEQLSFASRGVAAEPLPQRMRDYNRRKKAGGI